MRINENTKYYIQSKIPRIAKNIHEGRFVEFVKGAGRVAAQLGKDLARPAIGELKSLLAASDQSMLRRQRNIDASMLRPQISELINMSESDMERLHEIPDEHPIGLAPHAGGLPSPEIPDPKDPTGKTKKKNEQYKEQLEIHLKKVKDWNDKQDMLEAIAGAVAVNRNIGHLHRELYGHFVPGDRDKKIGHRFVGGSLEKLQSRLY